MSNGYFRLTWLISLFVSAGGAWVWLKIVTRADPRWKDKGHRWYLYLLFGIGSLYLSRLFYFLGYQIYGGNLYTPYDAANDLQYYLFINGPSEEWAKFIVFWILARGFNRVKEPRDGVIVAMMVALGFSLWENINYLIIFGTGSIPVRLIWASSGHMAYAAIWGYFAGEAILEPPEGGLFLKYRYVFTAVFVVSFVHGLFNFLSSWVSLGSTLALDLIMYALTLIVLVQVCRVPSAYQAFSYEKSSEAARAIRSALLRDPGNPLLYKRLGYYELYLGRESAALSSWKRIALNARGPYLNAWMTILESRVGKGGDGLERVLPTMTEKNRITLKRRLKFFLKSGSDIWLRRIEDWEQLKSLRRR